MRAFALIMLNKSLFSIDKHVVIYTTAFLTSNNIPLKVPYVVKS